MGNNHSFDVPDLTGKVIIVTGANAGIGFNASKAFVAKGAVVVFACRTEKKAIESIKKLQQELELSDKDVEEKVIFMPLDLSSLSSVEAFSKLFMEKFDRLDVLVNNGGIISSTRPTSEDGIRMIMATNHYGPFALTMRLASLLASTAGSRVVSVSSLSAKSAKGITYDDSKKIDDYAVYCESKLATLLFTKELSKKFEEGGHGVIVASCHPGVSLTNATSGFAILRLIAQPPEKGALPTVFAAVDPSVKSNDFVGPSGLLGISGDPTQVKAPKLGNDPELAAELWKKSVELTKLDFAV